MDPTLLSSSKLYEPIGEKNKEDKKGCFPLLSAYYQYPLAAVITRDRGQEGLWAKHFIVYRVNKGLACVHNDP